MSGELSLSRPEQARRQAEAQRQAFFMSVRVEHAREIHMMYLAKDVQPFNRDCDEEWKAPSSGDPDELACRAVAHADALMRALFPGFRIEKRE